MEVHVLWHSRPVEDDPDVDPEMEHVETEDKLCGVFSSPVAAEVAKTQLRTQPGFRDWPDHFEIHAYELDEVQWTEGFVTVSGEPDDDVNGE